MQPLQLDRFHDLGEMRVGRRPLRPWLTLFDWYPPAGPPASWWWDATTAAEQLIEPPVLLLPDVRQPQPAEDELCLAPILCHGIFAKKLKGHKYN
jgi:hypothetical protein